MNVASLELCKELYELSGWGEAYLYYYRDMDDNWRTAHTDYPLMIGFGAYNWPAYDLDYLLLKLEDVAQTQRFGRFYLEYAASVKRPTWRWFASFNSEGFEISDASNPTDAVAKLCIELFKQGILLKESKQ